AGNDHADGRGPHRSSSTRDGSIVGPGLLLNSQRGGDAGAKICRDLFVATLRHDDAADLELEGEALGARRALVEMAGDRPALPHRQLAVEILVDAVHGAVTIHGPVNP